MNKISKVNWEARCDINDGIPLKKPFIYKIGKSWFILPSASNYRNIKAQNFCSLKNKEASGEREPSQAQLL